MGRPICGRAGTARACASHPRHPYGPEPSAPPATGRSPLPIVPDHSIFRIDSALSFRLHDQAGGSARVDPGLCPEDPLLAPVAQGSNPATATLTRNRRVLAPTCLVVRGAASLHTAPPAPLRPSPPCSARGIELPAVLGSWFQSQSQAERERLLGSRTRYRGGSWHKGPKGWARW